MQLGKVVVVTGAARGLGRATALGLAEAGARVVAVHRPRPDGESLPLPADRYLRVDADVTSEDDCERIVAAARERFGSLDVLVNNAAIAHDPFPKLHADSAFAYVAADDWRRVLDVNVTGVFLIAEGGRAGDGRAGVGARDQHLDEQVVDALARRAALRPVEGRA